MPLEVGHGPYGWGGEHVFGPFLGLFVLALLAMAVSTAVYLVRSGRLDPSWLRRPRPEEDAKRVLAQRFAQGDITTDEFLERSSVLNWTPGLEPVRSKSRRSRG